MAAVKNIILAHHIKRKARETPDLDVATFVNILPDGKFCEEPRTYRDLWQNGQRIAAALIHEGLESGDSFGLMMQNHPEFVDVMVGSSIAGTVFVPIDPRTKGQKLVYMLDYAACRGVIVADYAFENIKDVLAKLPRLKWIWILGKGGDGAPHIRPARRVADILSGPISDIEIRVNDPDAIMQILYTSGTTGDPKAITSTYKKLEIAAMLPTFFGLGADDRPYTGLSLTHANAQLITLSMALYSGMRCVISRKFTKSSLWDITRAYGCTVFNLLGGMTTAIYSEPHKDNDGDNPVRMVISAGMPKAIWREFERRFGVEVFEFYGAAEGGLTFNPPGVGPIGSIGKAPPNLKVRIVDEHDKDCAANELGEIIFQNADGTTPAVNYLKTQVRQKAKPVVAGCAWEILAT